LTSAENGETIGYKWFSDLKKNSVEEFEEIDEFSSIDDG
jgi:hypothetical protein